MVTPIHSITECFLPLSTVTAAKSKKKLLALHAATPKAVKAGH